MDRLIGTYSGGMKRRLDLAAALMHQPQILFLDEPTTGLDPLSRARVWEEVREVNGGMGVTIFLTTQYLEEADAPGPPGGHHLPRPVGDPGHPRRPETRPAGSDLIIVRMDGDREAAAAALQAVPSVESVEIDPTELIISASNGAALISTVALKLNELGAAVQELTLRTPTLDDVFLQVTGTRLQEEGAVE